MNILVKALTFFCLITAAVSNLAAAEKQNDPDWAFGFGATGGMTHVLTLKGDARWDPGYNFGGGFIFQKMITSRYGVQSGIWYIESHAKLKVDGDKMDATLRSLTVPVYFVLSLNKGIVSFEYLAGINLGCLLTAFVHTNEDIADYKTGNVMQHLSPYQFGVSTGINVKFRVSKFIDLFVGIIGDFYATNIWRDHEEWKEYGCLYQARLQMGMMFRTNIFPMRKD